MSKISLKHSGGNVVSLNSPTSAPTSADVAFKLPNADGSAGQFMKTDGSGNLSFDAAGGGKILQVLQSVKTDTLQEDIAAGAVSGDITGLTVSITPSNASNKILISISVSACFQDANELIAATIYKSGSAISGAIGDASGSKQRVSFPSESYWNDNMSVISGQYLDTAGGTSAITYSVRLSHGNSSTKAILINRVPGSMESDDAQHMRAISTITVMEVAA